MAPDLPRLVRRLRRAGDWLRGLRPELRDAPVILLYHRVASPPWDPWGLAIGPDRFREQVMLLARSRTVVSVDRLVEGLATGDLPPRATGLTFDDGYADNARTASPILAELGLPATLFLTTGPILRGEPFWWDELAALVLGGREAADFACDAGSAQVICRWPAQDRLPGDLPAWRVGQGAGGDPRRAAYEALWRALQPLSSAARDDAMAELRDHLGGDAPLAQDSLARPLSTDEARAAQSDLLTLAVHGREHVPLADLDGPLRKEEIAGARDDFAAITGIERPSGMAYPHGSLDDGVRAQIAAAGYRWAVTTRAARINPRSFDPLALPRIDLSRRSGRELLASLQASGF